MKTIMIADDSASVRMMVMFTLGDVGFEIVEADNGNDALKKMERTHVDILITDVNMPGLDGISLVRKVREIQSYKSLPILMLTTETDPGKKMEGQRAGATGWIVKPFNPEELISAVKRVMV